MSLALPLPPARARGPRTGSARLVTDGLPSCAAPGFCGLTAARAPPPPLRLRPGRAARTLPEPHRPLPGGGALEAGGGASERESRRAGEAGGGRAEPRAVRVRKAPSAAERCGSGVPPAPATRALRSRALLCSRVACCLLPMSPPFPTSSSPYEPVVAWGFKGGALAYFLDVRRLKARKRRKQMGKDCS